MKTNNQFTVNLPDGWNDATVHLFMGPEDSGRQHMISMAIDNEAGDTELYDYAQERIELALESMQGAEIVKEEEKSLPDGRAIYECVFKWIPQDDMIIFKKQVFMIVGGVGYTFFADFSKKTIKTIGNQVDAIINSLIPSSTQENRE
ncbi:MAG: DcrB-related protein [candidate division Zixibacteria bacterium]|nr:DcrB-related protein [candidate division Zixibacteria bacterium]